MRAKPGNLYMAEAVPFGQVYTYKADLPAGIIAVDPAFWLPVRNNLRRGDLIRIVRVEGERVTEYAEVMVVHSGAAGVETEILREPKRLAEPAAVEGEAKAGPRQVARALEVKRGFGCYYAIDAVSGKVLAEFPTKKDAEAYIAEVMPDRSAA